MSRYKAHLALGVGCGGRRIGRMADPDNRTVRWAEHALVWFPGGPIRSTVNTVALFFLFLLCSPAVVSKEAKFIQGSTTGGMTVSTNQMLWSLGRAVGAKFALPLTDYEPRCRVHGAVPRCYSEWSVRVGNDVNHTLSCSVRPPAGCNPLVSVHGTDDGMGYTIHGHANDSTDNTRGVYNSVTIGLNSDDGGSPPIEVCGTAVSVMPLAGGGVLTLKSAQRCAQVFPNIDAGDDTCDFNAPTLTYRSAGSAAIMKREAKLLGSFNVTCLPNRIFTATVTLPAGNTIRLTSPDGGTGSCTLTMTGGNLIEVRVRNPIGASQHYDLKCTFDGLEQPGTYTGSGVIKINIT